MAVSAFFSSASPKGVQDESVPGMFLPIGSRRHLFIV